MKPIKKPELRVLKKTADSQPTPQVEPEPIDAAIVDPLPMQEQTPAPEYYPLPTPVSNYALIPSVGNSR